MKLFLAYLFLAAALMFDLNPVAPLNLAQVSVPAGSAAPAAQ
ncbi:MAG: hypothetical protein ACRBC3_23290 [Burkholderiaceae bacterium]